MKRRHLRIYRKRRKKKTLILILICILLIGIAAAERIGYIDMEQFISDKQEAIPYQKVSKTAEENTEKYYYRQLPEEQKQVYREILEGVRNHTEEIYVHDTDADETNQIFRKLMKDQPDIFWCDGTPTPIQQVANVSVPEARMIQIQPWESSMIKAIEKAILATIKPTEVPLDQLNARAKHALMGNLGIQYTYASEDRVEATMPVDERTRQPFGILHGGATLALAETVAGLGSMILAKPDEMVVGMQVSGSHMSSAHEGDTVRAVGTIIHKGRSSHVWNVDIFTSTDKLVSSVRVINSILKKK